MDFDDLDELAPVVENNQPPTGTVLEWIRRTYRLPGLSTHLSRLPEQLQKQVAPHVVQSLRDSHREKTAKVRLLCIHGVADTYKQDWFKLEADAPDEIEVAIHEFPGHGHREDEPVPSSVSELADDAFEALKESMETGSFALLGHSIGCLILLQVAKRAEAELNVKPVAVFMVERGAAQWPLFTEEGFRSLQDKDFEISLDLTATTDRSLDLNEKKLDGVSDKDAVLLFSSLSGGLIESWNAANSGKEVVALDEIRSVGGKGGTASEMHGLVKKALEKEAGEAQATLELGIRRRPYDFMALHQPSTFGMWKNGPTRALDRWQKTWRCENDTLEPGYHTFACPLIAIYAESSIDCYVKVKDLEPYSKAMIDWGTKIFNKDLGDGTAFLGHFPKHTFDDWAGWTENPDGFKVVDCPRTDHMSIKGDKKFKDSVYNTLTDLIKLWSRT